MGRFARFARLGASSGSTPRFAAFAWGLLAYEVLVVAWGAYVRATGSGAGCGAHWPLCNGEVVPRVPRLETLVELSHRVSSGVALVLALALYVWARRAYPAGDRVRRAAGATAVLMLGEALIGAVLVLFGLVAHDESSKRVLSVCMHLTNTFLLLAATALTAWWASGGARPRLTDQRAVLWAVGAPLAATILLGGTGAITALGDTLFPPASLAAGLAQDLSRDATLFVRLRTVHPVLAVATGIAIVVSGGLLRALRPSRAVRALTRASAVLVVAQVGAGLLDVALLAPVWLQLVHLAMADCVWVVLVLTGAASLAVAPESVARGPEGAVGGGAGVLR
jgi:heme A synthase